MKTIIVFLFALSSLTEARAEQAPAFRTEEAIEFQAKSASPFAAAMETDEYVGTLFREHGTVPSLRRLHVYEARKAPVALTAAYCDAVVRDVLYMLPQFPMKIERTELFKARFGNACEVVVSDADPATRHRQIIVSWVNRQAYLFIATFSKDEPRGQPDELRAFITSLR